MNLKALTYCVTVAQLGSFTKAAQALHVAQPALSMAVARLEEELGVQLFNRAGRQLTITAEGQLFVQRVEAGLVQLRGARQALKDLTALECGEIRVGIPPLYGIGHIPELLAQFRARYPAMAMHVVEGSADDIRQRLKDRQIDVALLEQRRIDPEWEHVALGSDEMVLCMTDDHPLANETAICAEQLQDIDMLVFDQSFLQRHLLDAFCANRQVRYRIALESNFVSLISRLACDGMGICTLLRSIQRQQPRLVGVPFDPPLLLSFGLCWRPQEYLSLANQRFVEAAQAFFAESAAERVRG